MINRRTSLRAALVAPVALAGCGTTATSTTTQTVLNEIQFLLPLVETLAIGISVDVPSTAKTMNTIVSTLNLDAAPIFQSIVATMTQEQSAPLVQKIEAYASAAMASIATVVANTPSLAKYANSVAQAQEVLTLIEAFVTGVTTGPVSARAPVPVPLLHR